LDQLLLNAKDKIIYSATYEDRQIAAEEENKLLKQQIYEMQRQADEPSELSHSRLENLNLQSKSSNKVQREFGLFSTDTQNVLFRIE
jgi:hypothetical protein